ncbi:hypothetical protein ABPG72_007638 [Tetrahymena utriculariae]
MVRLNLKSNVDQNQYPFLAKWDRDMRQNFEEYQNRIDATTYHLQRSQRGIAIFGEWMYPRYFQKDILELEVLRRKQQLGKIYPEEVSSFTQINPDIANDLNLTFNAKLLWPIRGMAIGSGFFALAHLFNLPYSFRLGLFIIPTAVELAMTWGNKTSQFKSIEFMDYLLQYRVSKALLEKNAKRFAEKKAAYQKEVNSNQSVQDLYNQLVTLVSEHAPSE